MEDKIKINTRAAELLLLSLRRVVEAPAVEVLVVLSGSLDLFLPSRWKGGKLRISDV